MKQKIIILIFLIILSFFAVFFYSSQAQAAKYNYTLMESIPGFSDTADFPTYILNIYKFGIWTVGIAALLMITIGGFMYMTSAGNTASAGTAKKIITDALLGLGMALLAYTVLYIINPDLVNVNINLKPTEAGAPSTAAVPGAPSSGGQAGNCNGFSFSSANMNASQCGDISPGLVTILNCIKSEGITAPLTSISDKGGFDQCKNHWNDPACAHGEGSCHYGGGAGKTDPECQKSHAVDISTRTKEGSKIIAAGNKCGGRVNDETNSGNHIHISDNTPCCKL
jgi:hypothetical protein